MLSERESFWSAFRRVIAPLVLMGAGATLHVERLLAYVRVAEGVPLPAGLPQSGSVVELLPTSGWVCIGVGFLWFAAANIIHFQRLANARGKGRCPQCGQALPERPVA